jgi:hypothetical protein
MSDVKTPTDICDALSAVHREVAARGATLDDIPILVAAANDASREVAQLVSLQRG